MIFRRIKAHIEKENWFAVFLDFAIVVVGVFIGIQVANWNAARSQHAAEADFLMTLHSEVLLAETLNRTRAGRSQARFTFLASALDRLYNEQGGDLTDEECTAIIGSFIPNWAVPVLPSIDELRSGHGLGIVRDAELKRAISDMAQSKELVMETVMQQVNFLTDPSQAFPEQIKLQHYFDETGEARVRGTCQTDEIRRKQGFINAIIINLDLQDTLGERSLVMLREFDALHQRLDTLLSIDHEETAP